MTHPRNPHAAPTFTLVTAHAYSPKDKLFTVGAYVREQYHAGLPRSTSFKVLGTYCLDELKDTARQEAHARIFEPVNVRHPRDMPREEVGRVSLERIKGYAF